MSSVVVPAILEQNERAFSEKLAFVRAHASRVQVDVCDGLFVPRISLADFSAFDFSGLEVEYHLMVEKPASWLSRLARVSRAIAHVELPPEEIDAFIAACLARGIQPGLALNPSTPLARVRPFLPRISFVTIMGVQPGFQGQAFLLFVLSKVRALRRLRPDLDIELDGGLQLSAVGDSAFFSAAQAGASSLVAGSSLWSSADLVRAWSAMRIDAQRGADASGIARRLDAFESSVFKKSFALRKDVVSMVSRAQSGHVGGAMGLADVFAVLWERLNLDPSDPLAKNRGRLIVSNGHICAVLYACLCEAGFLAREELASFRAVGSRLQGHPHVGSLPGVEHSGGPLSQGMSVAVGRALALRLGKNPARVYCVTGDGELDEGQAWEAFLSAAKFRLSNLVFLIDRNDIQIDDFTSRVLPLEPLGKKLASFGLHVLEIDAHDPHAVDRALDEAEGFGLGPTAIVCYSTSGKGVSFFEGHYKWHGTPPSADEAARALLELDAALLKIERGEWPDA